MKQNMMIDLETLGTAATSVIVSVGACVFTETEVVRSGYWVLDIQDQQRKGRQTSASTIEWWMKQSPEARAVYQDKSKRTMLDFTAAFDAFFQNQSFNLWGNGADFDLAMLNDFYERHGLKKPVGWSIWDHMCYRTFKRLFKCSNLVLREGPHHNAKDDAIHQAKQVIASGKLREFILN